MNHNLPNEGRKAVFALKNGTISSTIDNENNDANGTINIPITLILSILSFLLARCAQVRIQFLFLFHKDDIHVCVKYEKYIETHWFAIEFV